MSHPLRTPLSTLVLALLAAFPALAQTTPATGTSSAQLQRVEIVETAARPYNVQVSSTATKTDTPILETPFSVQVVDEALILDQQAYRLEDVIRNVSGVSSQTMAFSSAYETLQSRGFSTQPFRDGVRMMFVTVPLANAQQVEVLKGPAAVQYGRVEPGGMVNIVTKQPQAATSRTVEQQLGSYGFARSTADLTGAISTDKQWQYRLVAELLDKDAFIDHAFNKRVFIAPSLAWQVTPSTRINLSYERRDEKEAGGTGVPAIGERPAPVRIGSFYSEPGLFNHYMSDAVNLKLEHAFNEAWTLRSGLGAYRGDFKYANISGSALAADNLSLSRWGLASDFDHRNTDDAFVDLLGKFQAWGAKHTLLLGADHHEFDTDANWSDQSPVDINIQHPVYTVNVPAFLAAAPTSFWKRTDRWSGVYLQDQVELGQDWHVLAGGRYDRTDMLTGYSGLSLDDAKAVAVNKHESRFSPKLGLSYHAAPGLALYASYASAFGGWPSTSLTKNGSMVEPETSRQYEVGAKANALGGRLSATVALYELTKQHVATTDPSDNRYVVAIGEVRSRGLELDVAGKLGANLSLVASYAYNDALITQSHNGDQGQHLANAPHHAGSLWLKYELAGTQWQGLSLGAGVYAASSAPGDNADSFRLPGYGRVDVSVAYRFKIGRHAATAQLNVNNLFDRTYYPSAQGRAAVMPGEPRTALAALRLSF